MTYLLLDNERHARKLQVEAKSASSIHNTERLVTYPDHIQLWNISFEFDNFSTAEIAVALTSLTEGRAVFKTEDVEACRIRDEPGAALKNLYKRHMGSKPDKMKLTELLVEAMLSPESPQKVTDRPLFKVLEKITGLATRNPLPTMEEIWAANQKSELLGKLKKSSSN